MPSAYIETSVPSYYVARPSENLIQASKQASTRRWWDGGCSGLSLATSLETLDEAKRGDAMMAEARMSLLRELPVLKITSEAVDLAEMLVEAKIIPESVASDAIHIAVAAVHRIDYLVTWNFKHISNPFLRERIRKLLESNGYTMPVMCSPEELLQSHEKN